MELSPECLDKVHEKCDGCRTCSCHNDENFFLVCPSCGEGRWKRLFEGADDRCPRCRTRLGLGDIKTGVGTKSKGKP